ncbi:stage II sporulation protein M [Ferviditalea candida]|uniref:Stage II sporulation protein M n=1 Tax=Ferviditalea candida TaxID=3108399 RepID=A0ABU5ZJV0_9BACL|nr:stage II sporulation protein M [Paenibacillaceae bacterium T2]
MSARNSAIQNYMKEHLPLYVFVAVLFIMGVVFGALMVNALSLEQKQDLADYLSSFFHTVIQDSVSDGGASLQQTFAMHLKWTVLIFVLGMSVIGLPLILILDFLKGVLVGFTIGYLSGQLSWKGMLFALITVVPQNLIIIPALIACSVTAISFSLYLIRNRLLQKKGSIRQAFYQYAGLTSALLVILFGASLFEAYVSPPLMKWIVPLIQS